MAKQQRDTIKTKIKLDKKIIIEEKSKIKEDQPSVENINSSKMDFQIDPNNVQDAKQLIEFAEHLRKIHRVVNITADDQTLRIKKAIDQNLNKENLDKITKLYISEGQTINEDQVSETATISDEQKEILDKMGIKYDHLEKNSEDET